MVPIPDVRLVILTTVSQLGLTSDKPSGVLDPDCFPTIATPRALVRADDTVQNRQRASFFVRNLRLVLRITFVVSLIDLGVSR